jgi:hypothetical protein
MALLLLLNSVDPFARILEDVHLRSPTPCGVWFVYHLVLVVVIAVLRVPMTVVLEVIVVFMATRLVAAARKVDVRMIALVRAMAVVGQELTSSRSSGRTRLEGARCVPVRHAGCAAPPRYESPVKGSGSPAASQPEVGDGFGRLAGLLDRAGRGARRRLVDAAPLAPGPASRVAV